MRFTIRVYFVLFNEDRSAVLVSDERIRGMLVSKFPGGGLEWGEGTEDCARREALEELGQDIEIIRHLYTTGFFVASVFDPNTQVISIYYEARLAGEAVFRTSHRPFDFEAGSEDAQSLRWLERAQLSADDFTLPIDKVVAGMLSHLH